MNFWHKCLLPGLLLITPGALAQFTDNFSDGDFTSNPNWAGQNQLFEIASNQLHLIAPGDPGEAYLVTSSQAIEEATWEFLVRLDFNPSSNNLARIYLVSDQANLLNPLNGYFVRVGGTEDEVSLYRQSGSNITKIINGQDDRVDASQVILRVKVTRDNSGNWELFSDIGGNLVSEGSIVDLTHITSSFFGMVCQYTATRSDKFYFDDFTVTGHPFIDTNPPEVTTLEVVSDTHLRLVFSEQLAIITAQNARNYQVDNGVGPPNTAVMESGNTVLLAFNRAFGNGINLQLSVANLEDLNGNTIIAKSFEFRYFKPGVPEFLEVVITEVMADPDPTLALPATEYIELYNRGNQVFDLTNWALKDLSSESRFPENVILLPKEYIIICPKDHVVALSTFGKAVGLDTWRTLNNDGDQIMLSNQEGVLMHSLNYDPSWYRSSFKRVGGWSLEMIDVDYPCSGSSNWIASDDPKGGTPGTVNSVTASNPDLTGPQLISAFAESPEKVRLYFNEPLASNSDITGSYQLDRDINVQAVMMEGLQELILTITPGLEENLIYRVTVNNITDCGGNIISEPFNSADLALPQMADSLDLVINEVLFNPRPLGKRFVELFNRSDKFIDLKNWRLANKDSGVVANPNIFQDDKHLMIAPGDYNVITTNAAILKGQYPRGKQETFIEAPSLPSYPDDAGSVVLLNPFGQIIDSFDYEAAYHYTLLSDRNGVSLERLATEGPTNDSNNWKSAASTEGFATPGYRNSQSNQTGNETNPLEIDPKVFSFDTPGIPYFTTISFSFSTFGQFANVNIFDPQGHPIRKVASNELLPNKGFFTWDGTDDRGQKVRAGYYLILFEVFTLNGEVNVYKETVAIN